MADSKLRELGGIVSSPENRLKNPQVTPTQPSQKPSPAATVSPHPNPIGSLQEMCMKNNWSPPQYVQVKASGEPHSMTFITECKVGSWVARGQGRQKKVAKRLAAENVLSMITQGTPMNNKRKKQEKETLEKRLRKAREIRKRSKIVVDKQILSSLIGMKHLPAQLDLFSHQLNNLIKRIEKKFKRKKRVL